MKPRFVKITPKLRAEFGPRIAELEKSASYPLGNDRFRIDHGADYFAFFDRLGDLHYYTAVVGDRVVAVGAGIVRSRPERMWYLCDLKVHPDFRGRHLPLRMLSHAFLPNYLRCRRGYAISMNTTRPDGTPAPNRIAKMLGRFRWAPIAKGPLLWVYSLGAEAMRSAAPVLERRRGPLSYLSLGGVKDLVLESTGAPMPLLHVQFGPCAAPGAPEPKDGHTHMFCVPDGDPLAAELDVRPDASATIVHHRLPDLDWSFVLTSDV